MTAPLCKDCQYCVRDDCFDRTTFWLKKVPTEKSWRYSKCHNPNVPGERQLRYHLVAGGPPPQADPQFSVIARMYYGCGEDAKWFEPRQVKA